jgi:hypothetical protein
MLSSVNDVDFYLIVKKLLVFVLDLRSVFICHWEVQTYMHRTPTQSTTDPASLSIWTLPQ